jgi:hypothetical protein
VHALAFSGGKYHDIESRRHENLYEVKVMLFKTLRLKHNIRGYGWVVLVLALSACSTVRLGYNQADTLALYFADSYLDLDSEQEAVWRESLKRLVSWHRQNELPLYSKELARVQQGLQAPVQIEQVQALNDSLRTSLTRTAHMAAPMLADLMLGLRPEQVTYFRQRLDKSNRDYREEQLAGNDEAQKTRRHERLMTQLERWFGDFNAAQREQIRRWSDARPLRGELWYSERLRRQDELLGLMRWAVQERPPAPVLTQRLKAWIDTWGSTPQPERRALVNESREQMMLLLTQVANLTDISQKRLAVGRVQTWIDDFNVLVAQR